MGPGMPMDDVKVIEVRAGKEFLGNSLKKVIKANKPLLWYIARQSQEQ